MGTEQNVQLFVSYLKKIRILLRVERRPHNACDIAVFKPPHEGD